MNLSAEQLHAALSEMSGRLNHPLEWMRPILTELKDPAPTETRPRKIGVLRRARFDVLAEFYQTLMQMPEDVVLNCIIWAQETGEAPTPEIAKKEKKPKKGPHGKFWEELFLEGIIGTHEFKTIFGLPDGLNNWNEVVRARFEKDSLTHISPDEVLMYIRKNHRVEDGFEIDPSSLMARISAIGQQMSPRPTMPKGFHFSPADILGVEPKKLTFVSATSPESPEEEVTESDETFIKGHNLF